MSQDTKRSHPTEAICHLQTCMVQQLFNFSYAGKLCNYVKDSAVFFKRYLQGAYINVLITANKHQGPL